MAKRDALRDLQSRLAQRLSAVRTEAPAMSWLALESAGVGVLVPLAGAGEIFPVGTIAPVPHTQPWFLGVANLRGGLHGVVDFAAFLGLRPTQTAAEGVREQARLLALNPAVGSHVALLFERLAGLRTAAQMQREPDDELSRPSFAGPRWRDDRQRVWQEIDPAALVQHDQFLGIAR